MEPFTVYVVAVNIIGFILFGINLLLYTYTATGQIDRIITVVALLGGALGIVISILLFARKAEKENMMSRVFVYCVLIVQIVLLMVMKGFHTETLNLAIITFVKQHKFFFGALLCMNLVTFIVYGIDKYRAIHGQWRIPIVTLLVLAFLGGAPGGLAAVYLFKHKTKKDYFTVGLPLIIGMQAVVLFYWMNSGF